MDLDNLESNLNVNFSLDTCRICLQSGSIEIFDFDTRVNISKLLTMFTKIVITQNDPYPKCLCLECYNFLKTAVSFIKTARKSDAILKGKLLRTDLIKNLDFKHDQNKQQVNSDGSDDDDTMVEPDSSQNPEFPATQNQQNECNDTNQTLFQCKKCNVGFTSNIDFHTHKQSTQHKSAKKQCPICKRSYYSSYMRYHLLRHRNEKNYVCEICAKKFVVPQALQIHRRIHEDDYPFHCKLCSYKGRFKYSLKLHMNTHIDRKYACDQCGKTHLTKGNLKRHVLTHMKQTSYDCNECGMRYKRESLLTRHNIVVHSIRSGFDCRDCGKSYATQDLLKAHGRKHRKEKGRKDMHFYEKTENTEKHHDLT